jgi:photosystem II stability/assembly factor-like uncharacterized protein
MSSATDFAGDRGGLLRSTDLGETWQRIDRGITAGSATVGVTVHPQDPDQISFCTRRGEVFSTRNGGATWSEHPLPASATKVICVAYAAA